MIICSKMRRATVAPSLACLVYFLAVWLAPDATNDVWFRLRPDVW